MKKVTVIHTSFAYLAFDEENKLVDKRLFPKKPQAAANLILRIESGRIEDDFFELITSLAHGYDLFGFENSSLANAARQKLDVQIEISGHTIAGELARSKTEALAIETGFARDAEEYRIWMHDVAVEIAKLRVKGTVEKRDLLVAQAVLALDDLERGINVFMSHVREWYGTHFPELDRIMDKHETYARLVLDLGNKENFTVENLEKEEVPKQKAEAIAKVAKASMGADLGDTDLAQIQLLCENVVRLYKLKQNLESYLDKTMEEVAPNTKALVGSLLGARLVAISGGLGTLARKPASTIQILGAEKALFRSLKTGTRPPKHGVIFQHTLLHEAKRWQRGKISRALAGKLAIAARTDAFGGRNIGSELKASLDKRIVEIQKKYSEPPPPREKKRQPLQRQDRQWERKRRKRRRDR